MLLQFRFDCCCSVLWQKFWYGLLFQVEGDYQSKVAVNIFNNCADGTYDAIIMDVRMPVMDGLSAAKKIRTLPKNDAPTIPIIAMTADTFEEDIKRTEEAGMNAHLSKPINLEEVIRTLNRCLSWKEITSMLDSKVFIKI